MSFSTIYALNLFLHLEKEFPIPLYLYPKLLKGAARWGRIELFSTLFLEGNILNLKEIRGLYTQELLEICSKNTPEIAAILLDHGAQFAHLTPQAQNRFFKERLFSKEKVQAGAILIKHGADSTHLDSESVTRLMIHAIRENDIDLVFHLREKHTKQQLFERIYSVNEIPSISRQLASYIHSWGYLDDVLEYYPLSIRSKAELYKKNPIPFQKKDRFLKESLFVHALHENDVTLAQTLLSRKDMEGIEAASFVKENCELDEKEKPRLSLQMASILASYIDPHEIFPQEVREQYLFDAVERGDLEEVKRTIRWNENLSREAKQKLSFQMSTIENCHIALCLMGLGVPAYHSPKPLILSCLDWIFNNVGFDVPSTKRESLFFEQLFSRLGSEDLNRYLAKAETWWRKNREGVCWKIYRDKGLCNGGAVETASRLIAHGGDPRSLPKEAQQCIYLYLLMHVAGKKSLKERFKKMFSREDYTNMLQENEVDIPTALHLIEMGADFTQLSDGQIRDLLCQLHRYTLERMHRYRGLSIADLMAKIPGDRLVQHFLRHATEGRSYIGGLINNLSTDPSNQRLTELLNTSQLQRNSAGAEEYKFVRDRLFQRGADPKDLPLAERKQMIFPPKLEDIARLHLTPEDILDVLENPPVSLETSDRLFSMIMDVKDVFPFVRSLRDLLHPLLYLQKDLLTQQEIIRLLIGLPEPYRSFYHLFKSVNLSLLSSKRKNDYLKMACDKGELSKVEMLIRAGAESDIVNLRELVRNKVQNIRRILKLVSTQTILKDRTPFFTFDPRSTRRAQRKLDIWINKKDPENKNETALHICVKSCLRWMNTNIPHRIGDHVVETQKEMLDALQALLEFGATLIPDSDGKTPLDYALEENNESVLALFRKYSGYLNRQDEEGKTWLKKAFEQENFPLFHFLLETGARFTKEEGRAWLQKAHEDNLFSLFDSLLEAGAWFSREEGEAYLTRAIERHHMKRCELLRKSGANYTEEHDKLKWKLWHSF